MVSSQNDDEDHSWTATASAINRSCDTKDDELKQHEDSNKCLNWPRDQVPLEHRDFSCNRYLQNIELNALFEEAAAASDQELIPSSTYLKLPEEKSWICPLDSLDDTISSPSSNTLNVGEFIERKEGHSTKWILYNRASSPIILTYIALGTEVSATDGAYPAHSNTAAYPNGPIVLPGQMAVINGLQGHMFYAREYKEVVFSSLNSYDEGEDNFDALLWKNAGVESFRKSLPATLSFLPNQSRYTNSKGVTHVLGLPGRVLMKHRMGLTHVKNDSGAICPQSLGRSNEVENEGEDENNGRKG